MRHLLRAAAGTAVCLFGLSLGAQAQTAPPAGRLLASNCFQCHGTNGKGPGFDKLAGKSSNEIYKDLKEFQSGNGLHRCPAAVTFQLVVNPAL